MHGMTTPKWGTAHLEGVCPHWDGFHGPVFECVSQVDDDGEFSLSELPISVIKGQ